jgi:DNA processing protein
VELFSGPNLAALLTLPGVGEKRAVALAERFADWDTFMSASPESLCEVLGAKTGSQVAAARTTTPPAAILPGGVSVVSAYDPHYPRPLLTIPDRPTLLWWKGTLPVGPLVAVVGTRNPNPFGAAVAQRAATEAAAHGIGTVSGLALGCDSLAHQGSLDSSAPTWAVLGQGVDTFPMNGDRANLARRILSSGGGLLSEVPPSTPVAVHLLTKRNRLQSGLAGAVLIAQTGLATPTKPAGTLHTARFALEQGRYLAVATPPPALGSDPSLAGNAALTAPNGTSPETLHATNPATAALIRQRAPLSDLCVSSIDDFNRLWEHILTQSANDA